MTIQYPDISLDIETLSTRFDAAIVSIGAQTFDRDTGKMGPTFYQEVALDSAIASGHVEAGTLSWWMQQSGGARGVFSTDSERLAKKLPLATAMHALINFIRANCTNVRPWGNGATFDVTIVEHAMAIGCVGLRAPWSFMQVRDMRTIVDAAEALAGFKRDTIARVGVHHNAVDDAAYQAHVISAAWRALKVGAVRAVVITAEAEADLVAQIEDEVLAQDQRERLGIVLVAGGDDDEL